MFFSQSPQHIIRFVSFLGHDRTAGFLQHLTDAGDLLSKFGKHGTAGAFVIFKHLVTEGRLVKVEGNSQLIRLFIIDRSEKYVEKAQDGTGGDPVVGHGRQAEKGPVGNGMTVYQEDFLTHVRLLPLS